jgi:hypothetical protein
MRVPSRSRDSRPAFSTRMARIKSRIAADRSISEKLLYPLSSVFIRGNPR